MTKADESAGASTTVTGVTVIAQNEVDESDVTGRYSHRHRTEVDESR
ncbi:hypothetical protein [Neisseria gonorrhoeae]|nr:hypothetical protein [Neisseria gonorrhoeae]